MDFKQKKSVNQLCGYGELEKEILFPTCTLVNKKLYGFTSLKRLPIMVDLHKKQLVLLENIKNYDPLFFADEMLSVNDDIFILELNGNRLLKYNTSENICQYINIECHGEDWDNYAVFARWGNHLYIVSRYMNGFIKVEAQSGEVQRYQKDSPLFWCGCQAENAIWLFQRQGNLAVSYDMEQDVWKEYELSVSIHDCTHAMSYDKKIYILSSEGKVYCQDIEDGTVELLSICCDSVEEDGTFSRIAVTDGKIYVFPSFGKDIFIIDLDTKQVERYDDYPSDFCYCGKEHWCKYYGYCEDEHSYYFAMRSMNYMLVLNKKSGEERWIKLQLPSYKKLIEMYFQYNDGLVYEAECNMESMVDCMSNKAAEKKKEGCAVTSERIWEQAKER